MDNATHAPDRSEVPVPAYITVQRIRFMGLVKLVLTGWFLCVGSLWFIYRWIEAGSIQVDVVFGYLVGAPLYMLAVIAVGHRIRAVLRPVSLSVIYDPTRLKPAPDLLEVRRLTFESINKVVTSGWLWGAGWIMVAWVVYALSLTLFDPAWTSPCQLMPHLSSTGEFLKIPAPVVAALQTGHWFGLPGDIANLATTVVRQSCDFTQQSLIVQTLVATFLMAAGYALIVPGGVSFILYPGLRLRGYFPSRMRSQ